MKEIRVMLMVLILLSPILSVVKFPMDVNAGEIVYSASSNISNGGGGFGAGTSQNYYHSGDEGVRVTIVDAASGAPVSSSIDMTNASPTVAIHFGKVCKTNYRSGTSLQAKNTNYYYVTPAQPLPRIITTITGTANLQVIRNYFCDEQVLRGICHYMNFSYTKLINGDYKLMIEPVVYATVNGTKMAFTATEGALYNQQTGGYLRSKMPSLTHMNLPFAIYLEHADLGYPAWTGSTTNRVTDAQIIDGLGIGIVRFSEDRSTIPGVDPVPTPTPIPGTPAVTLPDPDYIYRTDTDVITAVTVSGGQSDPGHRASVTFHINGRDYPISGVYYPDGAEQLVWVKWHTPNTPGRITITVSTSDWVTPDKSEIIADIREITENPPPNPVADDRNDSYQRANAVMPSGTQRLNSSWSVWSPRWHAYLVWHENIQWHSNWQWVNAGHNASCPPGCSDAHRVQVDNGHWQDDGRWVDEGWWEFDLNHYSASLSASASVTPDINDPTAGSNSIKSGYGVNEVVSAVVTTNDNSAVTMIQNVHSYFPEFYYQTYNRMLERTSGQLNARFEFKSNPYSTYGSRTHFTPIWYPDGNYVIYTYVQDCWTPAGMLSANLSNGVTINGDLWDDWHIAPQNPD